LNFADARGRRHLVEASVERDVWTLRTSINGRPFTRECHSWQAVERTLTWLCRHAHESVDGGAPSSRVTGPIAAAIGAVMVLLSAGAATAQPRYPDSDEVRQFVAATRDYARMHRRIESALGPLEVNADMTRIHRAVVQFAEAIRAERREAKRGDLFTPALGVELRWRIADALATHGFTPADVRAAEAADGTDPSLVSLAVNGPFPWGYASAMFRCVIEVLPELPPELQYRIVGDTLVLVDVHASLIVDLLPSALQLETER
jgi:hypothetical protein